MDGKGEGRRERGRKGGEILENEMRGMRAGYVSFHLKVGRVEEEGGCGLISVLHTYRMMGWG